MFKRALVIYIFYECAYIFLNLYNHMQPFAHNKFYQRNVAVEIAAKYHQL